MNEEKNQAPVMTEVECLVCNEKLTMVEVVYNGVCGSCQRKIANLFATKPTQALKKGLVGVHCTIKEGRCPTCSGWSLASSNESLFYNECFENYIKPNLGYLKRLLKVQKL